MRQMDRQIGGLLAIRRMDGQMDGWIDRESDRYVIFFIRKYQIHYKILCTVEQASNLTSVLMNVTTINNCFGAKWNDILHTN